MNEWMNEWMSMEHWWNDTDRVNWSTQRKICPSVTFVYQKCNVDWPGFEPGPPWWRVWLVQVTARATAWPKFNNVHRKFKLNVTLYIIIFIEIHKLWVLVIYFTNHPLRANRVLWLQITILKTCGWTVCTICKAQS